jgi:hypothetical protein
VAALDIQFTPADLAQINDLAPPGIAAGPRYTEAAMAMVNR